MALIGLTLSASVASCFVLFTLPTVVTFLSPCLGIKNRQHTRLYPPRRSSLALLFPCLYR